MTEARTLAAINRTAVVKGRHPVATKRKLLKPQFKEPARQVYEANLPRCRNEKHAVAWIATPERYAFPTLGNMTVDQIGRADVVGVLTPIWGSKPETARRVRQRIRTVMCWAMAHGFVEYNVASKAIDAAYR